MHQITSKVPTAIRRLAVTRCNLVTSQDFATAPTDV